MLSEQCNVFAKDRELGVTIRLFSRANQKQEVGKKEIKDKEKATTILHN